MQLGNMLAMAKKKPLMLALAHTASLDLVCGGLGLILSLTGVCLLDLQELYGTSIGAVSHLITSRSVGALIGSVTGGRLFDRYQNPLLIIFTVALMSGTYVFVPLSANLYLAYLASFVNGIGLGAFDTGSQARLIKLWPANPGPAQHFYHFCFGLGSLLAPLLAQPFLSKSSEAHTSSSHVVGNHLFSDTPNAGDSSLDRNSSIASATTSGTRVQYAFLIVTVYLAVGVAFLSVLYIFESNRKQDAKDSEKKTEDTAELPASDIRFSRILMCLVGIYIAAYVTMECAYGLMLTTFGVKCDLHLPKATAVYLTEVFFLTFTVSRVFAALVAQKMSPFGMLLASKVILLATFAVLSLWGSTSSTALWVGTATSGIGQASLYGAVVSFCADYVVVTNTMMSVIIFTDNFGAMLAPVLVGPFIADFPMILMYLCFALTIALTVMTFLLYLLTKKREKQNVGKKPEKEANTCELSTPVEHAK